MFWLKKRNENTEMLLLLDGSARLVQEVCRAAFFGRRSKPAISEELITFSIRCGAAAAALLLLLLLFTSSGWFTAEQTKFLLRGNMYKLEVKKF